MLFDPKQPLTEKERPNPYIMKMKNSINKVLHLKRTER